MFQFKNTLRTNAFKKVFFCVLIVLACVYFYVTNIHKNHPKLLNLSLKNNTENQPEKQPENKPENKVRELELCPIRPPHLIGSFTPNVSNESLDVVEELFVNDLQPGGYYKPKDCKARDRVAIIIPSRNRDHQLPIFLKNLHPVLMRQQIEYQIFLIIQTPGQKFNKGALCNVGFLEAMQVKEWDCLIFHDVDLIPMDDRNLYDCPRVNPRHMSIDIDKFNFKLLYESNFGGVFVFTPDQYRKINGNSNSFWGWGGEDNDMFNRATKAGYYLERYPHKIATYKTLYHKPSEMNHAWEKDIERGKTRFKIDGLNSIKYHIVEREQMNTFFRILVDFVPEELGANSTMVKQLEPDH